MQDGTKANLSRRALLGAFAATAVGAAPIYANAAGFLRGGGDIRRIAMYSPRTGERIDTIYWIEGQYVKDALKEITYFMRDWRNDKLMGIDARTIDIMTAARRLLDVNEPYMLLSGYRSPETNAWLASVSRGVARDSQHMNGNAMDIRFPGVPVFKIRQAARSLQMGGVGFYPRSGFVHLDTGPIRYW